MILEVNRIPVVVDGPAETGGFFVWQGKVVPW
jgi:hypothetical protein